LITPVRVELVWQLVPSPAGGESLVHNDTGYQQLIDGLHTLGFEPPNRCFPDVAYGVLKCGHVLR